MRRDLPPCEPFPQPTCWQGCDPPTRSVYVAPDLTGLSLEGVRGLDIVQVRVNELGEVTHTCLLRGTRADIDDRVVAAVRRWTFHVAGLRQPAPPFPAGTVLPVGFSVGIPIPAR